MIKKNDKCVITNNTKNKIDLPLFKQNFKWRLNPNDTLEFLISSAEQGFFYLKQKAIGLDVTVGGGNKPEPVEGMLQAGYTYTSYTVDPQAMSSADLNKFCSEKCGDAEVALFVLGNDSDSATAQPMIGIQNLRGYSEAITKNAYVLLISVGGNESRAFGYLCLNGQTVEFGGTYSKDGWVDMETQSYFTDKRTKEINGAAGTIYKITDDFTSLNGTVISAEGGTPIATTPLNIFVYGDDCTTIHFSQTMSDDDLQALIQAFVTEKIAAGGGGAKPVLTSTNSKFDDVVSAWNFDKEGMEYLATNDGAGILWSAKALTADKLTVTKGWQEDFNTTNSDTGLTFAWTKATRTLTITGADLLANGFDNRFNGIVFGK